MMMYPEKTELLKKWAVFIKPLNLRRAAAVSFDSSCKKKVVLPLIIDIATILLG